MAKVFMGKLPRMWWLRCMGHGQSGKLKLHETFLTEGISYRELVTHGVKGQEAKLDREATQRLATLELELRDRGTKGGGSAPSTQEQGHRELRATAENIT